MRPDKRTRGPARPDERRASAGERVPAGRHRDRRRAGHRRPDDPVPRRRRPLHRSAARPRSRRCSATRRPRRPIPAVTIARVGPSGGRRRRSPTTSPGRSSTRARAIRRGPARSATAAADPIRRPVLRRAAGDVQPDWVDLEQGRDPAGRRAAAAAREPDPADEARPQPLPRFWYLPRGAKAAVVMTGDDHGNGGTAGRFDPDRRTARPAARRRLGVHPRHLVHLHGHADHRRAGRRRTSRRASRSALHVTTNCADWTPASLARLLHAAQLARLACAVSRRCRRR